MSIKRLINPNPLKNEKSVSYSASYDNKSNVASLLDSVKDGVFGVEIVKSNRSESFNVFTPIHYKPNLTVTNRHRIFDSIDYIDSKDLTFAQFYLEKASMFTLEMNKSNPIWSIINSIIPSEITVIYQLLLSYRQDNWKERLTDQYDCYLNGIENPSNNSIFRKFQVSLNEKVDNFLKWEYNHSPIEEVESKIKQDGFKYNFRIILIDGNKKQRELLIKQIRSALNKYSYLNKWAYITSTANKEILNDIVDRKFNGIAKNDVLCSSELIPFITYEQEIKENIKLNEVNIFSPSQVNYEPPTEKNLHNEDNPFSLLPSGGRLEEVDGSGYVTKFNNALKEVCGVKRKFPLINSQSGATLLQLTFKMSDGIRLSAINSKKTIDDIGMYMGVKGVSIEQGGGVGEVNVNIPLQEKRKVFLRDYIDTNEFRDFSRRSELGFLVGVSVSGSPIYRDLRKLKHLLIASQTGGGKSSHVNQMLLTLLLTKTPEELQLYLIDVKQTEFSMYSDYPHVAKLCTDADESITLLRQLIDEMNRRYKILKEADCKDVSEYNRKHKNKQLPSILCVIDEYAELTMRNKNVHEYVQSLTQLARASNITIILITQRPSADILPSVIKSNLPNKIAFRCSNTRTYLTFLNSKLPYELMGSGDGSYSFEGELSEHNRFQSCLITDKNEVQLVRRIAKEMKSSEGAYKLPKPIEIESELDKLKRIILENNTCKVNKLRSIMKVNINKLNDLMKELVAEEFLLPPESRQIGYKVNPDYKDNSNPL